MANVRIQRNLISRVNVGDMLTRTAWRCPDKLALVDGDRRLRYAEFNALVNRFANALLARGYERGDALALASGNSIEFLVTYYACAKTGIVCVPVNLGWRAPEVAYVLEHSRSRGVVAESQVLPLVAEAARGLRAADDVIVAPGTGTTPPGPPASTRCVRPPRTPNLRCSSPTGARSATCTQAGRRQHPRAW